MSRARGVVPSVGQGGVLPSVRQGEVLPSFGQGWRDATSYLRLSRSYRRDMLNHWLRGCHGQIRGIVLDVGGEKESLDVYPFPQEVGTLRRVYLNIEPTKGPDIVADGTRMPLASATIETAICLETLEHVLDPCAVVGELSRVLGVGGTLLLSVPFLFRIHGAPQDYWRFTQYQVTRMVEQAGLRIVRMETLGGFFLVVCEMAKQALGDIRYAPVRWALGLLFLPVAAALIGLERLGVIQRSAARRFTTGYAVLATKPQQSRLGSNTLAEDLRRAP